MPTNPNRVKDMFETLGGLSTPRLRGIAEAQPLTARDNAEIVEQLEALHKQAGLDLGWMRDMLRHSIEETCERIAACREARVWKGADRLADDLPEKEAASAKEETQRAKAAAKRESTRQGQRTRQEKSIKLELPETEFCFGDSVHLKLSGLLAGRSAYLALWEAAEPHKIIASLAQESVGNGDVIVQLPPAGDAGRYCIAVIVPMGENLEQVTKLFPMTLGKKNDQAKLAFTVVRKYPTRPVRVGCHLPYELQATPGAKVIVTAITLAKPKVVKLDKDGRGTTSVPMPKVPTEIAVAFIATLGNQHAEWPDCVTVVQKSGKNGSAADVEDGAPQGGRVFELGCGFGLHVPASTPPGEAFVCVVTGPALAEVIVALVQGDEVQVDPNADQLDPNGKIGACFIAPGSGEFIIRIARTDVNPPQIVEQSLFVEGAEAPGFDRIMHLSGKPQLPRIGDEDATGGSKVTYDVSGFEPDVTRTFEALEIATQTPWILSTVKPGQREVRFTLMSVDGAPVELHVSLTLDGTILAEDRLFVLSTPEPAKA